MRQSNETLVAPGRPHVAEQAGIVALAVPSDAEAVRVDFRFGLAAVAALRDEALARLGDEVLEENRLAEIGQPSAHVFLSFPAMKTCAAHPLSAQRNLLKGDRAGRGLVAAARDALMHL